MKKKIHEQAEIGIIGGTGVYDPGMLQNVTQIKSPHTPFGETSTDFITIGDCGDKKVAFLPRHGIHHRFPPHKVPSHANIWALNELGVKRIIAPSAVGTLQPNIKPGELVITDQFIDWTKTREYTYYHGGQVAHISMADPFCKELRKIAIETAKEIHAPFHEKGTLVCIEGPRFSTRAESLFFKNVMKADIIGMTMAPECILARELGICYLSIAAATDYDAWHEEEGPVNNQGVIETMKKNIALIKKLIFAIIPKIPHEPMVCECPHSLDNALM